jgi:hypothetical protein
MTSLKMPLLALFDELGGRGQGAPAARRIGVERDCLGSRKL